MKSKNNGGGGVSFVGLLQIAFIVLKLTNVISWSWWWVLSPVWIATILIVIGFVLELYTKGK